MDKKERLQAQRNELFSHSEDTLARIKELDKDIQGVIDAKKEPEETYSIGDRFEFNGHKVILVSQWIEDGDRYIMGLARLESGENWNGTFEAKDPRKITASELRESSGGSLKRYWDAAKQEHVGEKVESKPEKGAAKSETLDGFVVKWSAGHGVKNNHNDFTCKLSGLKDQVWLNINNSGNSATWTVEEVEEIIAGLQKVLNGIKK